MGAAMQAAMAAASAAVVNSVSAANNIIQLSGTNMKGITIQPEMGKIVLVDKSVMEKWRKDQESLKSEIEEQSSRVDLALRKENFVFVQEINSMEKKKSKELTELN